MDLQPPSCQDIRVYLDLPNAQSNSLSTQHLRIKCFLWVPGGLAFRGFRASVFRVGFLKARGMRIQGFRSYRALVLRHEKLAQEISES